MPSRQHFGVVLTIVTSVAAYLFFTWPDQNHAKLIFCDVGQGDAFIYSEGITQVLVDGGPDSAILSCLSRNLPAWDKTIELLVITHADLDHIGGLVPVLERYSVRNVLVRPTSKKSATITRLKQALLEEKNTGANLIQPFHTQSIQISQNAIATIWLPDLLLSGNSQPNTPQSEQLLSDSVSSNTYTDDDENARSIVMKLTTHNTQVLLMGDAPVASELALIEKRLVNQVDIVKIGHHGSKTSTSVAFLQATRPEHVVISCGLNNRYGHPALPVLRNLADIKTKIWRTDHLGTIIWQVPGTKEDGAVHVVGDPHTE